MIRAEYQAETATRSEQILAAGGARIQSSEVYGGQVAFAKLLSDSLGEALTDLVGARIREAIYDYMKRKHQISRDEIPQHFTEFFELMEQNFGSASSKVIGRAIAKKAYSKLDWKFQPTPGFEFNDYLERIKARLERGSEKAKTATRQFT